MRRPIPFALAALALLISTPGVQGTYPGENGLIVFEASTEIGVQLFTIRPDGTDIRLITDVVPAEGDVDGAIKADWSPDGSRIAFSYLGCQLGLIDPDGENLTVLSDEVETGVCESDPSFTPDGQSIVFGRYDGVTEDTWMMNVDGTDKRLLTAVCGVDPNVSPDGTLLSCKGDDTALWVMNMDGSGAMRVSPPENIGYKHDWAPDGSVLVFNGHPAPTGNATVTTVAPDGTGLAYLTHDGADTFARPGSYSPDGGSIVFQLQQDDRYALARMAADGSGVEQLTEYATSWPGLDGVGFPEDHYPEFDWGAARAE